MNVNVNVEMNVRNGGLGKIDHNVLASTPRFDRRKPLESARSQLFNVFYRLKKDVDAKKL